jgi:PncC family amidohydrolase
MDNMRGTIERVHTLLSAKGLTLSVAESCTGGLLAHYCTYLAGASKFFLGGVVAYSNEAKKDILGLSPEILENYGALSPECALEMARRARIIFNSQISLATTGNLGPDVQEGKEIGLVYLAFSGEVEKIKELHLKGKREENKEEAALEALILLTESIK